ncbi:sensor histidine kinase KdpD [Ideonella sp. A 288]|uniref:sensor histidine kinase n=1 Tax=Ideonella sp. A 288 TaxID=1962181 RepID=UPI001303C556|nr:sensor histidine kinase [Ideonella sp. A 288]
MPTDWNFDFSTAARMGGLIYLLMPATVWVILHGRHGQGSLLAWCVGASLYGMGFVLIGLRGTAPDWLSIYIGNLLAFASFPVAVASLRMEMAQRPRWDIGAMALAGSMLLFLLADAVSVGWRVLTVNAITTIGTLWLGWTAAQVWRATGLHVARMVALVYLVMAAVLVAMTADVGLGGWAMFAAPRPAGSVTIAVVTAFVVALYANLGFMGLAIERAHRHELEQTQQLASESAQRLAAEQHAGQLRAWLDERDEMLRLLAHEVRQPLNNATAALQAAQRALAPSGSDSAAAGQRVQRAELVLGQIIGTLDNTLAATALLASPDRVERRDSDVEALVALCIGDLDASQRHRVAVRTQADARTASMDAGLMRLALRNLLSNALTYSPPESPVVLLLTDSDDPLALVFEVIDEGQGVDEALAARLFERGVRGDHGNPGHGLGLHVVRRVMDLHGGSVDLRPNPAGGTIFRLTLPQDRADDASPISRPPTSHRARHGTQGQDQAGLSTARNT